MAGLEFIGGEKGGVGKSVMARVLAQYCIDHKERFIAFDTDRSHSTFMRFYGDFAAHVVIDDFASLDHLAEAISADPGRRILVDLAAQTMPPLQRWIEDSDVLSLLAEDYLPVRFWHVMDDGMDSITLLENLVRKFTTRAQYVIVLNHGRGRDFTNFNNSGAKALALEHGAKIIELRGLHEATMRRIDLCDHSFWSAINQRGSERALGLLERQRVKVWLNKTYADLAPLFA
jgi:hypothetical protein